MTLRQAIASASERLATNLHLRETAARDAELLLLHQISLSRAILRAHPERTLTPAEHADYEAAIARRLANEPIQYIIGQQEFYGLDFHVAPAVLIPRPETEHLVEAVLEQLTGARPLTLLDVGTGSGILAITLALHRPQARVTAVDISPEALAVARRNAATHRVADRIRFLQSDLLGAVAGERFDCIVSNPPYIPVADRAALHPQVREHEPSTALFAGPDGLDLYRRLIPAAKAALAPGGLLALEFGHGQSEAIAALLNGWQGTVFQNDLQGIPRLVLTRRPS